MPPLSEKQRVRGGCSRSLSRHGIRTMRAELQDLAARAPDGPPDEYGAGTIVDDLERDMAALLGMEAAVFLPKGVIAQLVALRSWADLKNRQAVVLHPQCHIDHDEDGALEQLHRLPILRRGAAGRPLLAGDIADLPMPPAAVVVELPLRRAGFLLPSWDELCAIAAATRASGAALHIDGARLWESQGFYGRSLAEIAGLADSIYVSFYKGLGALAGCVLAGSRGFIAATAPWRHRHGAPLFRAYPLALSARAGLETHLPRMDGYRARARAIATIAAAVPGWRIFPDPPHTNAFQVFIPGEVATIEARVLSIARETGVWLFDVIASTGVPGIAMGEIQVGAAADAVRDEEIVALLRRLAGL